MNILHDSTLSATGCIIQSLIELDPSTTVISGREAFVAFHANVLLAAIVSSMMKLGRHTPSIKEKVVNKGDELMPLLFNLGQQRALRAIKTD